MDGLTASYFGFLGFLAIMSVCYWVDRWQARRRWRRLEQEARLQAFVARAWWCLGQCETEYPGPCPADQLCWRCRMDAQRVEVAG